jgi:hypothetical protein
MPGTIDYKIVPAEVALPILEGNNKNDLAWHFSMIDNFAKTNKWIALKTSLRRMGISLDPFI